MQVNSISAFKAASTNFKGKDMQYPAVVKNDEKADYKINKKAVFAAITAAAIAGITIARRGKKLTPEQFAKLGGKIADDGTATIVKKGKTKKFTGRIVGKDKKDNSGLIHFVRGKVKKFVEKSTSGDKFVDKYAFSKNKVVNKYKLNGKESQKLVNKQKGQGAVKEALEKVLYFYKKIS